MVEGRQLRAVRHRVLPGTPARARAMHRLAGACRYVWNELLDQQESLHLAARAVGSPTPAPTFFTLGKAFTTLRNHPDHAWLKELPFGVVRYSLKRQADAWAAFFAGDRRRPRFKARHGPAGFTIPDRVRIEGGRIAIPKLGWVRLRRRGGNPHHDGVVKQAVFTRQGRKWFCTLFVEVVVEPRADDGNVVGVDRNVGQCALSTGELVRLPNTARLEARRRRYQRRMARQVKDSTRRRRTGDKLARTSRRIAGARADWAHQTSRRIADSAHAVVLEELRTKAMTRSAKGTREAPGTRVKAKAGLNRGILASGWGLLERHLEYKAGRVVRVAAAHTSQTCHRCGVVDPASRVDQQTFRCRACGHSANADVNAAKNIRRRGMALLDGEGRGCSKARPTTRQIGGEGPPAALRRVASAT